jgi:16S rRNA (adenine1518-N6/adenine1519-N6)-dimethyltransferase
MILPKKSLGQNFLIEKNIIKKIISLTDFKNKDILEIGPGKGALTDEILTKNPKSLVLIEKDFLLTQNLKKKYFSKKEVKIFNADILKFDFKKLKKKKLIVIGNLPYNISSQILIKIVKQKKIYTLFNDIIFMFQKELGEKILCKFPSKNYGRLSIITKLNLIIESNFLVSPNCFYPKPKVTSMVIHFKTFKNNYYKIKDISNLEKVTNILFSNRRKMINKSIKKILNQKRIKNIPELKLNLRPENINPELIYKITELFEKN